MHFERRLVTRHGLPSAPAFTSHGLSTCRFLAGELIIIATSLKSEARAMNHFPYVHEFLRSDTEIGPLTSIVLGGKGGAGGGEFVAIAGGIRINESRQVRFWTIVFLRANRKEAVP